MKGLKYSFNQAVKLELENENYRDGIRMNGKRKGQGREHYTFITAPPFEIQNTGNRGQRQRKKIICTT